MKKLYFILFVFMFSCSAFALEPSSISLGVFADIRANGFYNYRSKEISGYDASKQGFLLNLGKTSYVGADMKFGNLKGEVAVQNNIDDIIRVLYFTYDMEEYGKLMVGKNFTLAGYYFGQISDDNNYMRNHGTLNNKSEFQVRYSIIGISIGLVSKMNDVYVNYSAVPNKRSSNGISNDELFPRIELAYEYLFRYATIRAFSTYGYYHTTVYLRDGSDRSYSMNASTTGLAFDFDYNNFVTVNATIFYTLNGALHGALTKASLIPQYNMVRDKVDNIHSFGGAIAVNANITRTLAFRAGLGYMGSSSDAFVNSDNNYVIDDELVAFVGCSVKLAEYLYLIPEISYMDSLTSQRGTPEGNRFYAGAQLNLKY